MTLDRLSVSPYLTSVILRASDYGVSFVVELTREDLILVTFQNLNHFTGLDVPYTSCMVETSRKDLSALRVEDSLRNLSLMTL